MFEMFCVYFALLMMAFLLSDLVSSVILGFTTGKSFAEYFSVATEQYFTKVVAAAIAAVVPVLLMHNSSWQSLICYVLTATVIFTVSAMIRQGRSWSDLGSENSDEDD